MSFFERLRRLLQILSGAPALPASEPESRLIAIPNAGPPGRPEPRSEPARSLQERSDPTHGSGPEPPRPAATRFLLSVDGGGQFLVAIGARISLGHVRTSQADLPFLADVGTLHALLRRTESLRDGPFWSIAPLGQESVELQGRPVPANGARLFDHDLVRLGENLSFRFIVPDPASHTVLLELLHGAECCGAKTVCLLGEGDGGRLRIGAAQGRHVRIANLRHEISFFLRGERLELRSGAGVQRSGAEREERLFVPCPPPQRIDLSVGRPEGSRPPFSISLAPLDGEAGRG